MRVLVLTVGTLLGLFALGAGIGALTGSSGGSSSKSKTTAKSGIKKTATSRPRGPVNGSPASAGTGVASSDGHYQLQLATSQLSPGSETGLRFTVTDRFGHVVRAFQPLRGDQMRLIVVSNDLLFFTQQTPRLEADGSWSATVSVPAAGPYTAFARFKRDKLLHSLGVPLGAPGSVAATPAPPGPSSQTTAGGYELTLQPVRIAAGRPVTMHFTITSTATGGAGAGLALARAYLVGIRYGDLTQVYGTPTPSSTISTSHPASAATSRQLLFDATFPESGTYRLFLSLQRDTQQVTALLAVNVAPGTGSP